jgi:hypothetical protein
MSLLGLAAAYDSDSGSDSDIDQEVKSEVVKDEAVKCELKSEKVPVREVLSNPFLSGSSVASVLSVKPSFMQETEKFAGVKFENSVFGNPFRDKEDQKTAVLEHHVKLSQKDQTGRTIDGKKVCWIFRQKGKCRNGHNCKFAHDNDINNSVTEKLYAETKTYDRESQISHDKAGKGAVAPLPVARVLGDGAPRQQNSFDHISSSGKKLMEKMGWEAGKGLGARQHGIVNAIQVSWGAGGQGRVTGANTLPLGKGRGEAGANSQPMGKGEYEELMAEDEEQPARKKRPGLSDSLTLVSSLATSQTSHVPPLPFRARRRRHSTTKCTNNKTTRPDISHRQRSIVILMFVLSKCAVLTGPPRRCPAQHAEGVLRGGGPRGRGRAAPGPGRPGPALP